MIGRDSFRQEGSELSTEGPKGTPPTPDYITSSENNNTQEEGPYGVSYLSPKHPNITNRKWHSKWRRDASRGSGVGCADLWLGHDPSHNDPLRSGSPGSRSPNSGSRTPESGSPRMVSLSFDTSELPDCCTDTQREHSKQQSVSVESDPWGRHLGRSDPCHEPDHVTHDLDPVTHDPDPASHDPDPVTHDHDPASHDPDPGNRDPDPGSHDPDPVTHDPDPICHDLQQHADLEDRGHSGRRDAFKSVDSPPVDLIVQDLSSPHTTNNISDDVSVFDELASTLSDLHIWSGPETSPVIPLSEMCAQSDGNSTCKERSLPPVFMFKPESLKTVPIFSVNSSSVVPFAQSALTHKVNMAPGIEAAPENYSVLSPRSPFIFGNCGTDTSDVHVGASELNQKREGSEHVENQMKTTFWEMDVTNGAGLTKLTHNIAEVNATPTDMEATPTDMEATPTDMETTPTEMETTPTDIEVTATDNSFYTETLPSEGLPCCSGFRNAPPLTEPVTTLTSHATQSSLKSTQLISDYDESLGPDPPLQTQICTRSKTRGLRQKVAGETNDDQNDDNQEIRVVLVGSDVTKGTYIRHGSDDDETVSDDEWQRCCMRRVRSPDKPQIANIGAASGHGASAEENLTQRQESQRSHEASSSRRTTRALLAEARRTLRPRPVSPQGTYRHMVGETADALQAAVHLRRTSLAHRRSDVDQVIESQKQTLEAVLDRRSTMAGGQFDSIREGGQGYGEQVPYWVFVLTLVVTLPCLFYWILFL